MSSFASYEFQDLPPAKYKVGDYIICHVLSSVCRIDGINGCRSLNTKPEARYVVAHDPFNHLGFCIPSHICLEEHQVIRSATEAEIEKCKNKQKQYTDPDHQVSYMPSDRGFK